MPRFATLLLAGLLAATPAVAERKPLRLIRDAEIEHAIRLYTTPVFQAAGLDPAAIHVYLVEDKGINAFVAGGTNLFINTGLFLEAEDAGELIGVVAHETGHIAGGHLIRTRKALSDARGAALLATLLGVAVAVVGGGEAGVAIAASGTGVAERALLGYSRAQESTADQAALRYLDAAGLSARGLLTFLDRLADQELLSPTRQDPYLATHPLTRDRVELVRNFVANSPLADAPTPPEFEVLFDRIRAKLAGFIEPTQSALRRFPADDISVPARYGRAIALHRTSDLAGALALLDGLLAESPGDPFFHELKGQVLYESGRVAEAVPDYEAAVAALPDEPLLRVGLAQALLESGDATRLDAAVEHLEAALRGDRDFSATWRLVGEAYGRQGREPEAALAAAENALLLGRREDARHFAERALKGLAAGTPAALQAQDIVAATEPEL